MIIDRIMELAYKIIRPTKMLITSLSFEKNIDVWRLLQVYGDMLLLLEIINIEFLVRLIYMETYIKRCETHVSFMAMPDKHVGP